MAATTQTPTVTVPLGDLVVLGLLVGGTVRLLQHLWAARRRGVFGDPELRPPAPLFPPRLPTGDAFVMTLAGAVMVFLAFQFIALAANSVLMMFSHTTTRAIGAGVGLAGGLARVDTTSAVIAMDIGRLVGGCGGVLLLARWLSPSGAAGVGWIRERAAQAVLAGVDALFSVLPVCYGLAAVSVRIFQTRQHPVLQQLAGEPPAWDVFLLIFTAVVAAPLSEEFFFRGLIQSGLREGFARLFRRAPAPPTSPVEAPASAGLVGVAASAGNAMPDGGTPTAVAATIPPAARWMAIFLTSAVFAGIHLGQQPQSFGTLFALSAAMGVAFERTGSLAAPITVHVLFNALNVVAQFLLNAK